MKIPGSPVAYWASERELSCFEKYPAISNFAISSNGVQTGNNDRYVRGWYEVSFNKLSVKWFFYNKGGPFRKWYGNYDYVVNWENNGKEIKEEKNSCARGEEFYFKSGITWSDVTSGNLSCRYLPEGFIFDASGPSAFFKNNDYTVIGLALLNSNFANYWSKILNPTLHFQSGDFRKITLAPNFTSTEVRDVAEELIKQTKLDWDECEFSFDFKSNPITEISEPSTRLAFMQLRESWKKRQSKVRELEIRNNKLFIESYELDEEIKEEVDEERITLLCNPTYRFGSKYDSETLENLLRSETLKDLISYAIGCMMGRYSLDKSGLIFASQGETIQDYLAQIPSPKFRPDDDAILPLTDQEWFADDVTNRFREFVKVVWSEDTLQENLDFVAESLCLHAIKPKKGETSMETIRRYLSMQFYKDHMKTYKKRPIYWLFSSGKQKAFECLVYLHRYNEGTLSRMRTEYVTPLMGKYESQIRHIEEQQTSATAAEKTKLGKELKEYQSKLNELREFDSKLKHYADMLISLDLDDGVKVNYGKFGDLLANVKDITGEKP
ncbi:BREX-1 system adenine-specific DNA-methyltransferase PglX [Idiomarina sp.]|uniref:BREX-1 system adenine-specific DNA-methyltransferase PglX n=1 Tax=Idiomarina sp. TaxID=1874361 RepID=UPI003A92F481